MAEWPGIDIESSYMNVMTAMLTFGCYVNYLEGLSVVVIIGLCG